MSFEAYDGEFSEWLRERAEPDWTRATDHRFVRELDDGSIDDAVFRRYLVQDYAFVGTLVSVVGYAVGDAPAMGSKSRLADFLATLTDEENDYFQRAFDALDVPGEERQDPERTATTEAFEDLLLRGALEGDYEETLAVLLPAEWIYRSWARGVSPTGTFYHDEWIDLHDNPEFDSFVTWLRGELDEHGPGLSERRERRVDRLFRRTAALEVAFFDAAYGRDGPSGRS